MILTTTAMMMTMNMTMMMVRMMIVMIVLMLVVIMRIMTMMTRMMGGDDNVSAGRLGSVAISNGVPSLVSLSFCVAAPREGWHI